MLRVAINGYGRIGRIAHRIILHYYKDKIEVVGINAGSSTDIKGWMYLLKYDTVYGPLNQEVSFDEERENGSIGSLLVSGSRIPVFSEKEAENLPWGKLSTDVVIESSGHFRTEEKLKAHVRAGAKAVVLSAPVKEGEVPTYVLSVNAENYKDENIISNASCTTNCISPVAKIVLDNFGIEKAMMSTVHGYTSDQRLQDGGHKDYRRGRNAAQNIIPTSTGATEAASRAMPELRGKFLGLAFRVPVAVGSLSDFTFITEKETTKEEVNRAFEELSEKPPYKGILQVTRDPIVSSDIIGNPNSAVVDLGLTQVLENMVKVVAWYDNEYGYANRLVEEVLMVSENLSE